MVLAWDPNYCDSRFVTAQQVAVSARPNDYYHNIKICQQHREIIAADMQRRGFEPVTTVTWQANFNRNNNGSPADTVFEDHPVGGVSVKDGSDIIGNFGTRDFDVTVDRPRGEDLFRFLATAEFDQLLLSVKQDLLAELSPGQTWTEPRDTDHGKYSITRWDDHTVSLKFGTARKNLSVDQLLTESVIDRSGSVKKLAGKWRRVFGDYYQQHKKVYKPQRDALFQKLYPTVVELCEKIVISNPEKLCQIGGFTAKPYYVSDLNRDCVYFVPAKHTVIDQIKVEIFNKEKERSFGSGFELGCRIHLADCAEFATLDFYVCYNSGTFNRGPVIKIQNFQNKQKLWFQIH